VSGIITRLLPLLLLVLFQLHPGNAGAQQPDRSPNFNLGDAVVTGFSGTLAPDAAKPRPANKSAIDLTFINPDGPSARIIGIGHPGYVWDGRLFAAPKTFDVLAKDAGQVFGVALDDQSPPNIYVAATSVFGLNIVSRGGDGLPERRKIGGPGAGWMKGQFGLDLQGGPGGIYKIDGRTGAVTLFANVTLDGVPNPGPGLGNLAYDAAHKQLFVSDLYTGMIHRFDLGGNELSRFDHGVTGLGAAKLATVPFDPKNRPNIASERFDTEKPDTWGFAPAARRVWGLAVHEDRLYYSVVAGPQIWSVGIERDGSFAADPRWELDVPAQAGPLPVSDIAFSQPGAMILAQRALIAGAYDYVAFTQPGEPKVLRFWLKGPSDSPSPSRWKLTPEEYAVGFAGDYRNTDGGVALGYGYGADGTLNTSACEAALWTTGQNLRNDPALRSQLEPGGPLVVHGLQGSPADLVRNANTPPATSYFVDYDDAFDDPGASGHIGSVRIYTTPCTPAVAISTPARAVNAAGGGGGGGGSPPPPNACFCPATPIPASGPTNYITNGNFATNTLAGWTQGGTFMVYPVSFKPFNLNPYLTDPLTANSPVVPLAAGGAAYFVDDRAVNQSLSQSVTLPAGNYEVGFDLFVPANGAANPNDATLSAVIAGVTVLPTVSASSIISAETANGVYSAKWKHYSAFFSTCGGTYSANFDFNSFGGPASGGFANAAKDFMVDRVYIINSTTGGTNISCTGSLIIEKEVTTHGTLIPWPAGTLFPMTLTCTPPLQTWSFSLAANGTYTVNNIPFGGTCTVAEGPMPAFPPGLCPRGTVPAWLPPPFTTPPSVVIVSGTTATIKVHNSVTCEPLKPLGSLIVTKQVIYDGPIVLPSQIYPVTVTCGGTVTNLNLINGVPQTVNNIPIGTNCTVVEGTVPTPANVCPPRTTPMWTTVYVPPSPITITGMGATELVKNTLTCSPIQPSTCPPPQVPNVDGICVCPSPMVSGPVAGTCICPPGDTQVGGKCVPTLDCRKPLIPNAAGTECVCGRGLVLRGGKCVEPIVCKPPATLNSAGTACLCPKGMVKDGNACVEPERNPRINTPRGMPGFGGFGGGTRGGQGGNPGGGQGGPTGEGQGGGTGRH
jgi:hypothetical protein